ncbi:lipoprotein signal peptidase [Neisseria shayeganii]|uniref:lipoprotein signal peptidase n=1 Tax=Neisseria shayeganii TaxID=607712 RepID=UPI001FD1BD9E|nr:lipoprotein signal peptidase [Neisseria shayeganii]
MRPRPSQNPHLRRISALCAAHSLAYLSDMYELAALLRLELHPHLGVLQRSQALRLGRRPGGIGVFA